MNRSLLIAVCCVALPLHAALRFGLGDAVAKRGAELINKAGAQDARNAVGDAAATTLSACPAGAIYDTLPTDLSSIGGIVPLGNLAPTPHTLPADHIYFYASSSTVDNHAVFAPGLIHITDIAKIDYPAAIPSFSDYSIYFYSCKDVKSYFFHVRTLAPGIAAQTGPIDQNCHSETNATTVNRCNKEMNLVLPAGTLIGQSPPAVTFDFGSYDYRATPLAFISPSRHYADQVYTVCPIDYFAASPKAALEAKLGRYDGGLHRTVAPLCGEIQYDVPGAARGDWYRIGSPDAPEDPHLALVQDNITGTRQACSVGSPIPNQGAVYVFEPVSSGHVDRDFRQVTADGTIYCYDTFYDPVGQLNTSAHFLIQMPTATTLRFEKQEASACGQGPWSFTGSAVNFQR